MSKSLLLCVPLLALTLGGCATIGTLQTAETNGAGNFQAVVEPGYMGLATEDGAGSLAILSVSGRYGVSDRVDIGGRIGTTGAEVMGKFMLTDPEGDGPAMSLAPSFGGFVLAGGGGGIGSIHTQLPLIIGIPVGEHQLVLGPKAHFWFAGAGGGGTAAIVGIMSLGSSVGFAAKLGPNFRLMPEVSVVVPTLAIGSVGGTTETATIPSSGAIFQVSMGLMFGGRPD